MRLKFLLISASVLVILCASGCKSARVVFVDAAFDGHDVVRLGGDVKGHVYFPKEGGGWEKSRNKVTLPEGWYALPVGNVEDEPEE